MDSCLWVHEAALVTHTIIGGFKGWVSFMTQVGEGEGKGEGWAEVKWWGFRRLDDDDDDDVGVWIGVESGGFIGVVFRVGEGLWTGWRFWGWGFAYVDE